MSIVFGVPCTDGIVIGVDFQYTKGSTFKTAGPKLFPLVRFYDGSKYSVLIAGVGNSMSSKKVYELIDGLLPDQFTFQEFVKTAEAALAEFTKEYLLPWDSEAMRDYACEMMFAVRIGHECRLYAGNGLMLVQQREPLCLGEGVYLGDYLIDNLMPRVGLTVAVASQFIANAISSASDYIVTVGKGTSIHILRNSGVYDRISSTEFGQELHDGVL